MPPAPADTRRTATGQPFLSLPLFEGPLDLLLHLCRREELPLQELPVARVTEQFLVYLDVMEELHLEVAGEFLEMAALLCLLKSRELLPETVVDEGEDEDEGVEDPRAALIARLLEYKSFRAASLDLRAMPQLDRDFFLRPKEALQMEDGADPSAPIDVDLLDLLSALRDLLESRRAKPEPVHQVGAEVIPLALRMNQLLALLEGSRQLSFDRFFDDAWTRPLVVVTFLALLELAKLGHVRLRQGGHLELLDAHRGFEGVAPRIPSQQGKAARTAPR